jgi:DNA-binding response OmpR family regulator
MSDTHTREWRELCLQALTEMDPKRRMAIVLKLRHILRRDVHQLGPLWIDFESAEVKRDGKPIFLTNLEFRLLAYLIERAGTAVSPDELLRSVLGYESGAVTQTVKAHVHNLRQKLEQNARRPELIVTVPGAGYKFVTFFTH